MIESVWKFVYFVLMSFLFKVTLITTVVFVIVIWTSNKLFDSVWWSTSSLPLTDLKMVYKPPADYNNMAKLNIKLIDKNRIAMEGNIKFKFKDNGKQFDFYDTIKIRLPENEYDFANRLYFQFENSNDVDSVFLVVSKSESKDIFWNQIFFSSVTIENLNKFSDSPEKFRVNFEKLVNKNLLEDNDNLIEQVLVYFNSNKENLKIGDCSANSNTFREVCNKFGLPCRIVTLHGGDADETGFFDIVGYPLHALCEIYSSKFKKWYVVDPTYGFRYKNQGVENYLNTVEISNKVFFDREREIIQDSILFTKRNLVDRDYFKYYENIYFNNALLTNRVIIKLMHVFFGKFNFRAFHYSNNLKPLKNGFYYIGMKSIMYLVIVIIYVNVILFFFTKRLLSAKRH